MKHSLSVILAFSFLISSVPFELHAEAAGKQPSRFSLKDRFVKIKNKVVPWVKNVGTVSKDKFKKTVAVVRGKKSKNDNSYKSRPRQNFAHELENAKSNTLTFSKVKSKINSGANSYASGGDDCSPACARLRQCGLMDYSSCMDYCYAHPDNSPENRGQAQWSCDKLASRMGGPGGRDSGRGDWACRAVGTYVPPHNGSPDYGDPQNVDITQFAPTRDVASEKAMKACSDMLYLSANQTIRPGSLVTEECQVLKCDR